MELIDHVQNVIKRSIYCHHLRSDPSSHFSENCITQWLRTITHTLVVNWIYHQNCGSLKAVHKVVTVQFLDIQITKHKIFVYNYMG